jgi:hypothetical protein
MILNRKGRVPLVALALGAAGCGERAAAWQGSFTRGDTVGLTGSVAMIDRERNELMMLTAHGDQELGVRRLQIGKNVVTAQASLDKKHLFVLTSGEARRLNDSDERPQLFVVSGEGEGEPAIERVYQLSDPPKKLTLDDAGEWAIAHDAGGVVTNPNELILVQLGAADAEPVPKTLRSIGGRPKRFTFTGELSLPNGERHRLLVVETEQDVAIIDLSHPERAEITVPLPKTSQNQLGRPAQVVYHDDLPGDGEVASYLAVRFDNDSSVLTLRLSEPKTNAENSFSLIPNLVDAGALPSTIDFVETDRGLRLAALVPAQSAAVLFDPATSKSERVDFDRPYSGIARITNGVDVAPENGDVALLYSASAPSIAFWRLGYASATPYASFDSYSVDTQVASVLDIPGDHYGYLKLLIGANSSEFFLLDLKTRQSYPMQALAGFGLRLSPDGQRMWAFSPSGLDFARLTFGDTHPTSFAVERPIADIFDIARQGGGHSALVLHDANGRVDDVGVTLFDAENPDSAKTRFVSGLKLEGL